MKRSRWLTILAGVVLGGVSQLKPAWAELLYGAIGLLGWAVPHMADKAKQ